MCTYLVYMYAKYVFLFTSSSSSCSSVSYIRHRAGSGFPFRGLRARFPMALFRKLATTPFLLLETPHTRTWVCDSVLLDHAFTNSLYCETKRSMAPF